MRIILKCDNFLIFVLIYSTITLKARLIFVEIISSLLLTVKYEKLVIESSLVGIHALESHLSHFHGALF
jgi:hypothetical protein